MFKKIISCVVSIGFIIGKGIKWFIEEPSKTKSLLELTSMLFQKSKPEESPNKKIESIFKSLNTQQVNDLISLLKLQKKESTTKGEITNE